MSSPLRTEPLLTVHIADDTDCLLARQRAKQIARLLHFELQDQTRIATAVSEIARNAWEYARGGKVEFFLDAPGAPEAPQMRILVSDRGKGIPHLDTVWNGTYASPAGMGLGLIGARRLMDSLEVQTSDRGTVVSLLKRLPGSALSTPSAAQLSQELAREPATRSNALLDQNQELLRVLADLRAREGDLRALNEELAETSRGVLVLYAELEDKARAVQQASESKSRFLSGVTHELRTPLNSIVSLSRLMLSHSDGPLNPEQEKQAHFILRSAQNLTEMVNDLLDLARLEAGKTEVKLTPFIAADLLAGLRGMFRPLSTNPNVQLIFQMPSEPVALHTDEGKVAQILRNFISNALKFTLEGTITVKVHPGPGSKVTFEVEDTGCGIAAEHHDLVMQEWGQVAQVTPMGQPLHKGSGLGLPLSRSFADLLGGKIDFTSEPRRGSTFRLTLPALLSPEPASPPGPVSPLSPATPRPTILIADADEVSRYLLRRQLAAYTSAAILEAATGEAVLHAIRGPQAAPQAAPQAKPPALVFLDPLLPGPSAPDLIRRLRGSSHCEDLPIVIHTAKPPSPEEARSLQPFDLTVILKPSAAGTHAAPAGEYAAQIERALLQVGLSNQHEGQAS